MADVKTAQKTFRRISAVDRRRELVEAGIVCLGRGGMAGFTIDQICKQAKISRGLINHHFTSKEELLTCIYAVMTDHLVQQYPGSDASQILVNIIETSFDEKTFNRSNLRAWLAIWGQVPSNQALKKLHEERYDQYRQRLIDAIEQHGQQRGNAHAAASVARQLIALIDGLWLEYCLHSESFSLAAARSDCYQFLEACGIGLAPRQLG